MLKISPALRFQCNEHIEKRNIKNEIRLALRMINFVWVVSYSACDKRMSSVKKESIHSICIYSPISIVWPFSICCCCCWWKKGDVFWSALKSYRNLFIINIKRLFDRIKSNKKNGVLSRHSKVQNNGQHVLCIKKCTVSKSSPTKNIMDWA